MDRPADRCRLPCRSRRGDRFHRGGRRSSPEFSDPESNSKILRMEGSSKSPALETWAMEPADEAAVMDPASDVGAAESASSVRAASSAAAEFPATLLWAEMYSEARRWIVRTWLSESRSRGGDSRMQAESSETMM